jgi:hypothetical protein
MTTTYQLTLTLPGTEADGQLDIFAVLELLPADVAGYAAEWSTPARDITTWQGMAEELAERLLDFEALTLPAQGLVIGAALAIHLEALARTHTFDNGQTLDDYLVGMHKVGTEQRTTDGLAKFIAKDALAMSNAWGVEQ